MAISFQRLLLKAVIENGGIISLHKFSVVVANNVEYHKEHGDYGRYDVIKAMATYNTLAANPLLFTFVDGEVCVAFLGAKRALDATDHGEHWVGADW